MVFGTVAQRKIGLAAIAVVVVIAISKPIYSLLFPKKSRKAHRRSITKAAADASSLLAPAAATAAARDDLPKGVALDGYVQDID